MKRELTEQRLSLENERFAATAGVSHNNRTLGFLPAFRDRATGEVYLSRFADGRHAPIHLLEGLPDALLTRQPTIGGVRSVKNSVVSGFVRDGYFYTRVEAARTANKNH